MLLPMKWPLTQQIRKRLRSYGLLSQLHRDLPRVLVKMATEEHRSVYGYGPWTWWILGAQERQSDDWLFGGVMSNGRETHAGLFAMDEIRALEGRWWIHIERVECAPFLPDDLIPVWRDIDSEKPIRVMEFTIPEIKEAENEVLLECFNRPLDQYDLDWANDDATDQR